MSGVFKNIVITVAALAAAVVGGYLGYGWFLDNQAIQQQTVKAVNSLDVALPPDLTEMSFSLTNEKGEQVGPNTIIGKTSVVFFGYSFCPDICPTALTEMAIWLDELGAENMNAVFISVDPERDDLEQLEWYTDAFHPAITGWTGSVEQIDDVVNQFHAKYEVIVSQDENEPEYLINHTATVFVFDAQGRYRAAIDQDEERRFALGKIKRVMDNP